MTGQILSPCSHSSRPEEYTQCRESLFSPRPRARCSVSSSQRPTPHWRSSALLRVLRLCSLVLLRDWALVPLVVLRPDLSLAFRLMAPWPRHSATSPRSASSRRCWRTAWSRPRRPSQFSRRRGSRRDLQRQQLHREQLRQLRAWLWPWLPLLAVCGGGLCLWQILCLVRGRLHLRVYLQAIRHEARSGLSWRLIEADGPTASRSCTGASGFGRT
jgi:hypothetical protein